MVEIASALSQADLLELEANWQACVNLGQPNIPSSSDQKRTVHLHMWQAACVLPVFLESIDNIKSLLGTYHEINESSQPRIPVAGQVQKKSHAQSYSFIFILY